MKIRGKKLKMIEQALQYAVLYAKTEAETAEFAQILLDVQSTIIEEVKENKRIEALKSLKDCPFTYCDSTPKCEGKCRYR